MKTTSNKSIAVKAKSSSKLSGRSTPKGSQRKPVGSTDLNIDNERTNADASREENDYTNNSLTQQKESEAVNDQKNTNNISVEEEEDRESLRKIEGNHPDEAMN